MTATIMFVVYLVSACLPASCVQAPPAVSGIRNSIWPFISAQVTALARFMCNKSSFDC